LSHESLVSRKEMGDSGRNSVPLVMVLLDLKHRTRFSATVDAMAVSHWLEVRNLAERQTHALAFLW
jgi:hypothetical protein